MYVVCGFVYQRRMYVGKDLWGGRGGGRGRDDVLRMICHNAETGAIYYCLCVVFVSPGQAVLYKHDSRGYGRHPSSPFRFRPKSIFVSKYGEISHQSSLDTPKKATKNAGLYRATIFVGIYGEIILRSIYYAAKTHTVPPPLPPYLETLHTKRTHQLLTHKNTQQKATTTTTAAAAAGTVAARNNKSKSSSPSSRATRSDHGQRRSTATPTTPTTTAPATARGGWANRGAATGAAGTGHDQDHQDQGLRNSAAAPAAVKGLVEGLEITRYHPTRRSLRSEAGGGGGGGSVGPAASPSRSSSTASVSPVAASMPGGTGHASTATSTSAASAAGNFGQGPSSRSGKAGSG